MALSFFSFFDSKFLEYLVIRTVASRDLANCLNPMSILVKSRNPKNQIDSLSPPTYADNLNSHHSVSPFPVRTSSSWSSSSYHPY